MMARSLKVAIGALGGSGTRIVAELLGRMGIYMGNHLNAANDNLIFSILFKNPTWYRECTESDFQYRLGIFEEYMIRPSLSDQSYEYLLNVARNNQYVQVDPSILSNIRSNRKFEKPLRDIWGWKEPNSQLFAAKILKFWPDLKYIHVLRNGLDMAFARNRQQLFNWGPQFNIEIKRGIPDRQLQALQLEYWVAITKFVIKSVAPFRDRVLIINYTDLCLDPKITIAAIANFCNLKMDREILQELSRLPIPSSGHNRYLKHNITHFPQSHIEYVKSMGFNIT